MPCTCLWIIYAMTWFEPTDKHWSSGSSETELLLWNEPFKSNRCTVCSEVKVTMRAHSETKEWNLPKYCRTVCWCKPCKVCLCFEIRTIDDCFNKFL